ncbi:hypothetical protein BOC60_20300 [Burkholderia pseudomallei]|nr:hypothetical protein BOC60_20300 [Burkholderia pseudomallei]
MRQMLYGPTGMGKTALSVGLVKGARAKGKRVAFLCNRIQLVEQASAAFRKYGIDHGVIQGQNSRREYEHVLVCSIQTVAKRGLPDVDFIIIDEAHGVAGSKDYRGIIETFAGKPVIGLSATPFAKGLGKHYDKLNGPLFERMVIASTIGELIEDGYLVDCDIYAPSEPDMTGYKQVRNKFGELDFSDMDVGEATDKPELIGDIVTHWLKLAKGTPTVVFASNIAHSKHIVEQFLAAGVSAEHIDCYDDTDARRDALKRFESGQTTIISNSALLAEGWDAPFCQTLILARPTKSLIRYIQMCLDAETEILTRDGWKRHETILETDEVAVFDKDTGEARFEVPSQIVRRPLGDEKMFAIDSPHLDLRVTAGHEMVWAARKFAAAGQWRKTEASELAERKSHYAIPVSGTGDFPGVDLADDEIRFLGLFITDGSRNRQTDQVYICQSCAQPDSHHEYIKSVLTNCGFRFGECRIKRTGDLAKYADVMHYTVSKGIPNRLDERHLRGWGDLASYMDKNICALLDRMTVRQFDIFLEALNMGDGKKFRHVKDWTPQTLAITTGDNLEMANRLQAMCVVRGYRCNIARHSYNQSPLYMAYISKKAYACVGGSTGEEGRSRLAEVESDPGELVWCVTTQTGNIFVRRNGKAAIVGNCGRVLRPADGKIRALILDHSGTVKSLGFPTDDLPLELDDGKPKKSAASKKKEEKLPTACVKCSFMKVSHKCPACGFAPEKQNDVHTADGELVKQERGAKKSKATQAEKQQFYSELLGYQAIKGYSDGRIANIFREKHGVWPNAMQKIACEPSQETKRYIQSRNIAYAKGKKNGAA